MKKTDFPQAGEEQIEGESSSLLSSDGLPSTVSFDGDGDGELFAATATWCLEILL